MVTGMKLVKGADNREQIPGRASGKAVRPPFQTL